MFIANKLKNIFFCLFFEKISVKVQTILTKLKQIENVSFIEFTDLFACIRNKHSLCNEDTRLHHIIYV